MSAIKCYEITYEFKASFYITEATYFDKADNNNDNGSMSIPKEKALKNLSSNIIYNRTFTKFVPYTTINTTGRTGNEIASKTFNSIITIQSQDYIYNSKTKSINAKLICLVDETTNQLTKDNVEDILYDNMNELYNDDSEIYLKEVKHNNKTYSTYMIVEEVPTNIQIQNI
jgi:hypothetical protein